MNLIKRHYKHQIVACLIIITLLTTLLSGCGAVDLLRKKIEMTLLGTDFKILVYDDYGNNSLTLGGRNVNIKLFENYANTDSSSNGFKSEVLELTVNGNQMLHVGSTTVFAENGLNTVEDYDYSYLQDATAKGNAVFVPLDRSVNHLANLLSGAKKTIIIKSQLGVVVGVYQGDRVSVEIPDDLPQTTRLVVDGKSLYIYRADYEIFDTSMLQH